MHSVLVRVTAHNGVSDQDPDRFNARTVEVCEETRDDVVKSQHLLFLRWPLSAILALCSSPYFLFQLPAFFSDYYYVEISDPDNLGSYAHALESAIDNRPPSNIGGHHEVHQFSGLRRCTQYCVRVTAHNGVSDQDPDRFNARTIIDR